MQKKFFAVILFIFILLAGCSGKKSNNYYAKKNSANLKIDTKSFIFVGISGYRAALYKYNFNNKKVTLFWDNPDESVMELSYSKDMKTAFFLTANDYGKTGAFPFINDAKIYMISVDSGYVEFIKSIGSGIQVFMAWSADNTFKVILNSFDKTIANYVNQHTRIFNTFGKILFDEIKTYDLTKEGYPKPATPKTNYKSPVNRYSIFEPEPDSLIYLLNQKSKRKYFIAKTTQSLNQIEWTPGGSYLIFSTINISQDNKTLESKEPVTSTLFIYSLKSKRLLNKWDGGGLKNFYILNNFLIFDNGFSEHSSIYIVNYKTLKPYDHIVTKHGCGLRNIPRIPDYK